MMPWQFYPKFHDVFVCRRHELNNGYYRLFPLFVAETIVTDLLKYFFIALTFSSLFYPIVPFDHSFEGWLYAFVIYYLGAQCFISVARILTCTLVWDESYSHRYVSLSFAARNFFSWFVTKSWIFSVLLLLLKRVRFLWRGHRSHLWRPRTAKRLASCLQLGLRCQSYVVHDQRPHPPRIPRPSHRRGCLAFLRNPLPPSFLVLTFKFINRMQRSLRSFGRNIHGRTSSSCFAITSVPSASKR